MAFYGNTFDAFTIAFTALSLVFAVAATGGDSWVAYGEVEDRLYEEAGLWKICIGHYGQKECFQYKTIAGKNMWLTIARALWAIVKMY